MRASIPTYAFIVLFVNDFVYTALNFEL